MLLLMGGPFDPGTSFREIIYKTNRNEKNNNSIFDAGHLTTGNVFWANNEYFIY